MTSMPLVLDVIRIQFDGDIPSEIICPDCPGDLVIHQPDEVRPDRLLGTCPSCSAWFLINTAADVMIRLPDEDTLRGACMAARSRRAQSLRPVRSRRGPAPSPR